MNTIKWLLAGIVVGIVAVAFRDLERGEWLAPALPSRDRSVGEEEPVLGYDGMDQETALDWISSADLEEEDLRRMLDYERANLNREPVVSTLEDLLG